MNKAVPILISTLAAIVLPTSVLAECSSSKVNASESSVFVSGDYSKSKAKTIEDLLAKDENLSTLSAALTEAGLLETLNGLDGYTVFAPTNKAFEEALSEEQLNALLADTDALTEVLTYHVLATKVPSSALEAGNFETVEGSNIEINLDDKPQVNGANIITTDLSTKNGKVHTIDQVLLPEGFSLPE